MLPHPSVVLAAGILDELLGDPEGWPHPVRAFGWIIARLDRARCTLRSPFPLRLLGTVLALGLPSLVALGVEGLLLRLGPWRWVAEVLLGAWMLAGRSLREAVAKVATALEAGDLPQARWAVGRVVGRDTASLDEAEVVRASLETLAESLCDGFVAPLFWFVVAGLPGLWAFKVVSTLDSMVGHREAPWTHFGWASARLDDGLNYVPARLTVGLIALASGSWRPVRMAWRDGGRTASPNAGVVEAAWAGALDVQLGGVNTYDGLPYEGPRLGDPGRPLDRERLREGLRLCRRVQGWALLGGTLAAYLIGRFHG